jgi:hypothetical protein
MATKTTGRHFGGAFCEVDSSTKRVGERLRWADPKTAIAKEEGFLCFVAEETKVEW